MTRLRKRSSPRPQTGFTLIEVMIVVVVVGILVGIALPAYQDSVRKSHRAAAQGLMMDIANRQQQFLLSNRAFAADLDELKVSIPADISARYLCDVEGDNTTTPPGFVVTCQPTDLQRSGKFSDLSLTDTGLKSPAGEW